MSRPAKHKIPLQRAALELFAARGYSAVSIRDIAGRTGMAEGTLYRHYSGKEALAQSLYAESRTSIDTLLDEVRQGSSDVESFVSLLVVRLVLLYQEDPAQFRYVMAPAPDMRDILQGFHPLPLENLATLLETLLKARSTADRPALLIASQLLGSVLYVFDQYEHGLLGDSMDRHIDGLVQTALRIVRE